MRVYLPVTLPMLSDLVATQSLVVEEGYAVTPGLTEWYASGDVEELEWAATVLASRASLRRLAAEPSAPARRAVLAVELEVSDVERGSDEAGTRGRVHLRNPVPWRAVAAALVDSPDAATDVAAARDALSAADRGDQDAMFVVEAVEGHDLLWFAAQEIEYL